MKNIYEIKSKSDKDYVEYDENTFYTKLKPYLFRTTDFICDSSVQFNEYSISYIIRVFTFNQYRCPEFIFKLEIINSKELQEWKNSTIVPQNNQLLK